MADEFRSIRDNLLKTVVSTLKDSKISVKGLGGFDSDDEEDDDDYLDQDQPQSSEDGSPFLDAKFVKELIGTIFSRAGKSKDEIVNIVAREIGVAVAAALKEPLKQLALHQRLQISFEFVPKDSDTTAADSTKTQKKSTGTGKKSKSPQKGPTASKAKKKNRSKPSPQSLKKRKKL